MTSARLNISVIIPAFNEADNIQNTLTAIMSSGDFEIIVVDNGSNDNTAELARLSGAKVISFPEGTIAAVRNRGVEESNGEILVFLDADVVVTQSWKDQIVEVIEFLTKSPMTVTGSRVLTNNSDNWINRYWYSQLTSYDAPYINSGHLITTRELFNLVKGFTDTLETAEDYDFCQKVSRVGGVIFNNPELKVVHEGYPTSLRGFITRERWHGSQDVNSWKSFRESKIAWLAAFNLGLLISCLFATLSGLYFSLLIYPTVMYLIAFILNAYKFGKKPASYMVIMPILFYFYLWGRSWSLIDKVLGIKVK